VRRREFITLLGGAVAGPLAARAQQPAMPVIGFLHPASPERYSHLVAAFRKGLGETGFVEGQNVVIEYRWAKGQFNLLPALAADLVTRQVAVLVTGGSPDREIGDSNNSDCVQRQRSGWPGSRPQLEPSGWQHHRGERARCGPGPKRLELLRELVPNAVSVGLLVNPSSPVATLQIAELQEVARAAGVQVQILKAVREDELSVALAELLPRRADAMVVTADPLFNDHRDQLVAFAAHHAIPTIYEWREYVDAGGLVSYGASLKDTFHQLGIYAGRILKGAKPADLPIEQPTKFELVINRHTAKALGLTIPDSILLRADEVIE
jgi:putative tryptophan/tyrosine transport system substrate-binding protein